MFAAGADLGKAIDRVEAWYVARGLPSCFQLTDRPAPATLYDVLEQRDYARLPGVSVLVAATGPHRRASQIA